MLITIFYMMLAFMMPFLTNTMFWCVVGGAGLVLFLIVMMESSHRR